MFQTLTGGIKKRDKKMTYKNPKTNIAKQISYQSPFGKGPRLTGKNSIRLFKNLNSPVETPQESINSLKERLKNHPFSHQTIFSSNEALRAPLAKINFFRMFTSSTNRGQKATKQQRRIHHKRWFFANQTILANIKSNHPPTSDRLLHLNQILGESIRTKSLFKTPGFDPIDIYQALSYFDTWLETAKTIFPPIVLSTLATTYLLTVHPFNNANGRTARLLTDWMLAREGYPFPSFLNKTRAFHCKASNAWDTSYKEAIKALISAMHISLDLLEGKDPLKTAQENKRTVK